MSNPPWDPAKYGPSPLYGGSVAPEFRRWIPAYQILGSGGAEARGFAVTIKTRS